MNEHDPFAETSIQPAKLEHVLAHGVEISIGSRVKLCSLGRADVFDMALEGMIAVVVSIEQDFENRVYLSVAVEDDPGKDFGHAGLPGHRFFFGVDEVQPISDAPTEIA